MNVINLTGRIVKDADLAMLGNNIPKISFALAVERNYQKDKENKVVDFIPCVLIGRGEKLQEHLTKGKKIAVLGELNIDNYEKDGQKRSFTKVKVDRLEFLDSSNASNGGNEVSTSTKTNQTNPKFELLDDDDIPF